MVNKQAGKPTKLTLRKAKKIKRIYLDGYNQMEIVKLQGVSKPQINRYFRMLGGLSLRDRALHLRNRIKLQQAGKL